jgi:hypothetical protein
MQRQEDQATDHGVYSDYVLQELNTGNLLHRQYIPPIGGAGTIFPSTTGGRKEALRAALRRDRLQTGEAAGKAAG